MDLRCRERSFDFLCGQEWSSYGLRVGRLLAELSTRKGCILALLWLGGLETYGYRPLWRGLVESFTEDLSKVCDYTIVGQENITRVTQLALGFEGIIFLF